MAVQPLSNFACTLHAALQQKSHADLVGFSTFLRIVLRRTVCH